MNSAEQMENDFNAAINYALDPSTNEGLLFLRCWREGDWTSIEEEWPRFKISDALKHPNF